MIDSSSTPFYLSHQGLNDKSIQSLLSEAYLTLCPSLSYISTRLLNNYLPLTNSFLEDGIDKNIRKLRVGFISTHFFDHSIGRMFSNFFLLLNDIQRLFDTVDNIEIEFNFWVFFIDSTLQYEKNNWKSSTNRYFDSINQKFYNMLGENKFIFLPNDISLIREIVGSEEYNLDCLIFTDIGMDLTTYLLSHSRLAPYQVPSL